MTNSKTTKKALLSSALALTMCVAMLIATTFAWFTDTASTSVNKIQAGTLDVELQMAKAWDTTTGEPTDWENAEGKTLQFRKAEGAAGDEAVLWEPGCTYQLPELRVVNKGNLALKYKIAITGITGDTGLNKVITWTTKIGEEKIDQSKDYTLLKENDTSGNITISGKMDENAGNEYQGAYIDGVSVTVYATQATGEYDSKDNTYDSGAGYNYQSATIVNETSGKTFTLEKGKTYAVGEAEVKVKDNGDIEYTNANGSGQTVSITTNGQSLNVTAPKDTVYHYGPSGFVEILGVAGNSYHEFGEVAVLAVTKGRVVIENGNNVKTLQVKAADGSEGATTPAATIAVPQGVVLSTNALQIAANTSVNVTVINKEGAAVENESFTIAQSNNETTKTIPTELVEVLKGEDGSIKTFDAPKTYVAMAGDKTYTSLTDAIKANVSEIKLLQDATISEKLEIDKSLTIDLNNYTLKYENANSIVVKNNETVFTLKNGTFDSANVTESAGTVICNEAGTTTTLDNVKAKANQTFLYPAGDASQVNVINGSEITAGAYGVGTNAGDGNKTGISITISDSKVTTTCNSGDNCAVLMNVGGTLNITNSKITGDRQGVFLRAGNAEITNSTIKTTGKFGKDTYSGSPGYWGSGNEAPRGALLLGSYDAGTAYKADVKCILRDSKLIAENGANRIVAYERKDYKVTFYDTYPWEISQSDDWKTDENGVETLK